MKKLSALLLVVVIALLGLPGLLGTLAQRDIEAQLTLTEGNPMMSVAITDYDRGWFTSTVRYEVGFTGEYRDMIEQAVASADERNQNPLDESLLGILSPFEMVSKISHGPVGLLDGPFLGLFKSITTESENNPRLNDFLSKAKMRYLIEFDSITSLTGHTAFSFQMPPTESIDYKSTPNATDDSLAGKLTFSGATGRGNYRALTGEGAHVELTAQLENLSVKDDKGEFTIKALLVTIDSTFFSKWMGIGLNNTSIGSLIIRDQDSDEPVEAVLQNLAMNIDSDYGRSKETLDIEVTYRIGKGMLDGQTFADIEATFAMNEMSIAGFEQYNQWAQVPAFDQAKDPADQKAMLAAMTPILYEFLGRSPTISIDPAQLTMNGEKFLANVSISLNGSKLPSLDNYDALDVSLWTQIASGQASLTLSEDMALLFAMRNKQSELQAALGDQQEIPQELINQMAIAQAPILVQTLVQQGLLLKADDQISAGVSYENGELLLNSQPIPLDALPGI